MLRYVLWNFWIKFQMNPLDVLYPPPSYFDLTALKLPSISEDNEGDWSKGTKLI